MVKLEIPVCPARTEKDHHPHIDQKVKYKVDTGHNEKSLDRVDCKSQESEYGEIGEPDDVADGQDDVEKKCSRTVLDEVHLPHLVEEIYQDEDTITQTQPTCPVLVSIAETDGQRIHLLRDL